MHRLTSEIMTAILCVQTHAHIQTRQFSNTFYRPRITIRNSFAISREMSSQNLKGGRAENVCVREWERESRRVGEREVEWELRSGSCRTLAGDACGREGGTLKRAEAAVECIFGLKFMRSACRWGSWACLKLLPVSQNVLPFLYTSLSLPLSLALSLCFLNNFS